MTVPRIAILGAGYMGTNHGRVITASPSASVGVVIDIDLDRARRLATQLDCDAADTVTAALGCDAAVVATATDAHVEPTLLLLEAGIPVLVEKPLANEFEKVELLLKTAEQLDVPLMCGFVERFNPVVTTAQQLMDESPLHIVALRHSPAAPRMTNSTVHDLLIHDIDLAIQMTGGASVEDAYGTGWAPGPDAPVEIADCTLRFNNGAVATLSASRASQRKLRLFQICTPSMLLELDLLRHDLTIYRNVRQEQDDALTYRAETIVDIPFVRHSGEPLTVQLDYFLRLIRREVDFVGETRNVLETHRVAAAIDLMCASSL